MLFGLEMVALTKEVELKMSRLSLGMMWMNRIRNKMNSQIIFGIEMVWACVEDG